MGWFMEDGLHEGYLRARFDDGALAIGVSGAGIPDGHVASGGPVGNGLGDVHYTSRPAAEVVGWVVCCDCADERRPHRPSRWLGPEFARVPTGEQESLPARRIYAADADVADVAFREDVEEVAQELWRHEHMFEADALAEVSAAAQATLAADDRLRAAVLTARAAGSSWEQVGAAAGMTRQGAHERWRSL